MPRIAQESSIYLFPLHCGFVVLRYYHYEDHFYDIDGQAYGGAAAVRFSRVGARNQARGRDSFATCGPNNDRDVKTSSLKLICHAR